MRVHISLQVEDLDESISFYQTLFDQPATKKRPDYANFRLDQPSIHLALEQRGSGSCCDSGSETGTTQSHFGLELPDAETWQNWHDRLEQTGLSNRREKDIECCYARAEKLWFSDPDGNPWEIWLRTGDSDRM